MRRIILYIMMLGVLSAVAAFAGQGIVPTPLFMDIYGFAENLSPGDVVTAVETNGVTCGQFTVKKIGQYGFMHVYGDDPSSPKDEGAVAGQSIEIRVNGKKMTSVVWAPDLKKRLDF